jgi:DNA replication protein DnaC
MPEPCPTHNAPDILRCQECIDNSIISERERAEKKVRAEKPKPTHCPHHGTPYDDVKELEKDGEIIFSVPICYACRDEVEEREELERRILERAILATNGLKLAYRERDAQIPDRFASVTFSDFEVKCEGQKKAVEDAKWFLDNLTTSAGLILMGILGTGKTLLACIILNEVLQKGNTALFADVRKIDRAFKDTWRKDSPISETELLAKLTAYDVLVIDEVGVQRGSSDETLHIAELVNDRYNARKPTILIGNMELSEFEALVGERAVDRLQEMGRRIVFDWEGYRGRVG